MLAEEAVEKPIYRKAAFARTIDNFYRGKNDPDSSLAPVLSPFDAPGTTLINGPPGGLKSTLSHLTALDLLEAYVEEEEARHAAGEEIPTELKSVVCYVTFEQSPGEYKKDLPKTPSSKMKKYLAEEKGDINEEIERGKRFFYKDFSVESISSGTFATPDEVEIQREITKDENIMNPMDLSWLRGKIGEQTGDSAIGEKTVREFIDYVQQGVRERKQRPHYFYETLGAMYTYSGRHAIIVIDSLPALITRMGLDPEVPEDRKYIRGWMAALVGTAHRITSVDHLFITNETSTMANNQVIAGRPTSESLLAHRVINLGYDADLGVRTIQVEKARRIKHDVATRIWNYVENEQTEEGRFAILGKLERQKETKQLIRGLGELAEQMANIDESFRVWAELGPRKKERGG
jgi:hypothetical protein